MSQLPAQGVTSSARQGLMEIDPNRIFFPQHPVDKGKPVVSAVPCPWPQFAPAPLSAPRSAIQPAPLPFSTSTPTAVVDEAAPSRKRNSDTLEKEASNILAQATRIDDQDPRLLDITDDCDVVRCKIRALIDSGEMKVGEFQRAIGVSSTAHSTFMKQDGPSAGQRSAVYKNAFAFFKKRELDTCSNTGLVNPSSSKPAKRAKKDDGAKGLDVSNVTLPGEEDGCVPVYDTCNEIRKKIRAFLKKTGMPQAGFCRELTKMVANEGRKVNASHLARFLTMKGPSGGAGNIAFYAAYVFFEKIRVRDGKPKSQMRQEMEIVWGEGGMHIPEDCRQRSYFCFRNERPYEDKYGQIQFLGR